MAELQTFELPFDYAPDPTYVNVPPDYQYLAWRVSVDEIRGTSLWSIQQVAQTPDVEVEDLLPEGDFLALPIGDGAGVQQYGYTPAVYPAKPVDETVDTINTSVDYVQGELQS